MWLCCWFYEIDRKTNRIINCLLFFFFHCHCCRYQWLIHREWLKSDWGGWLEFNWLLLWKNCWRRTGQWQEELSNRMGSNGVSPTSEMAQTAPIVEKPTKRRKRDEQPFDYAEIEQMLPEQFDDLYRTLPLTEDTTCGIWMFKGAWLQKWVSKFRA